MQKVEPNIVTTDSNNGVLQNSKVILDYDEWIDCSLQVVIDAQPQINKAEIMENSTNVGGVNFLEGHAKLSTSEWGSAIFAKVNQKGNLQVFGNESENYYINANGHLIYKYCHV